MALKYKDIEQNPRGLISFTGYRKKEFEVLLEFFEPKWDLYIRYHTLDGQKRKRTASIRKNNTFPRSEDLLMLILHYWKAYPLQEVMAVTFGMKQPQINRWIKVLKPILKASLAELKMLPERDTSKMKEKMLSEKAVVLDGTEREIQRPLDYEVQKEYYSGKKRIIQ